MVMQNKATGEVRSVCVWSEGVRTLLPRADEVGLMVTSVMGPEGVAPFIYFRF